MPRTPFDDFRPSPGRVEMYYQPGGRGVRVDTHAYAGYVIPPSYDSMIGKLITYGKDRREAMDKMSRALGEYLIAGVKTTISFQQAILQIRISGAASIPPTSWSSCSAGRGAN